MIKKQYLLFLLWGILSLTAYAQKPTPAAVKAVTAILYEQQADWNAGDISSFMEGYWQSDRLVFMGSQGPTFGYENVKQRYEKNYATKALMGRLQFTVIDVQQHSPTVIQMLGKFELERSGGNASGYFSLLWRKTDEGWKIVSDHTSASNQN